jgi:hypothetical protein
LGVPKPCFVKFSLTAFHPIFLKFPAPAPKPFFLYLISFDASDLNEKPNLQQFLDMAAKNNCYSGVLLFLQMVLLGIDDSLIGKVNIFS